MPINRTTELDSDLQIEMYMTDLQKEALPEEIFDKLGADYIYSVGEQAPSMPNAIYLKLDAKVEEARTVKVPLIKELSEDPQIGSNANQVGNEEDWITKFFTMQYTDISHATTNQQYGILARDKAPYKVFEYRNPGLGKYFKQYFGKMRRQALIEGFSENLDEAPHFLADMWSPNWYIAGLANTAQPTYEVDYTNHTARIVQAIQAAGIGQNASGTLVFLQRLEEYARTEMFIVPLDFEDGSTGYVLTLPTPTARWYKNPTNGLPTLGALYTDATKFSPEVRLQYPGLIGQVGSIRIVEDPRYATLTVGGSVSTSAGGGLTGGTLTPQYRGMGRADDGSSDPRDKTANARLVGHLLGKGALMEWMPEPFHWEWEYEQYDKYYGSGIFMGCGIRQPIYNLGTETDASAQQDSSIVVVFAQPPATSL